MATPLVLKLGNYPKGLKSGTAGFGPYQFTTYTPEHGYELTTVLDESGNELWNKSSYPAVLVAYCSNNLPLLMVYTYDGRHEVADSFLKLDGKWTPTAPSKVFELFDGYLSSNSINILPSDFDHTKLKRYTLDLSGLDNDPYLVHSLSYNSHGYKLKWLSPQHDTLFNEVKYGHDTLWKAATTDTIPLKLRFVDKGQLKYLALAYTDNTNKLYDLALKYESSKWAPITISEYESLFSSDANNQATNSYLSYHVH